MTTPVMLTASATTTTTAITNTALEEENCAHIANIVTSK
jgi:hypothetical protein